MKEGKDRNVSTAESPLHRRNKHVGRYDLKALVSTSPALSVYVLTNKYGDASIDFFDPDAVKALNSALLSHYYGITFWDIPKGYLCPPIPGRADYIHHIAEFLDKDENIKIKGDFRCLDIGVGANCVYPIIGSVEYDWSFVGADIDPVAIKSAEKIIHSNSQLTNKVELRLQRNKKDVFNGVIQKGEHFDLTICNPPFHASKAEAQAGSRRKVSNLKKKKTTKPVLNFGGQSNELWCDGGELTFVKTMIAQSKGFRKSCTWFSTLISKESNLKLIYKALNGVGAKKVQTINMGQGNKVSRVVVWTF